MSKKAPTKATKAITPKKTSKAKAKTVNSTKPVKKKVTKKSPSTAKKTVKKCPAKKKATPKKKTTGRRVQFAASVKDEEEEEEDTDDEDGGGVCPEFRGRIKYSPPSSKPKAGSIEEKIHLIAKEIDRPVEMLVGYSQCDEFRC